MNFPQFGRIPVLSVAVGAAANTAKDGSGTITSLVSGRQKVALVTADASTDLVTVSNWSRVSNQNQIEIMQGDRVRFVSGTAPGGTALDTEYAIASLSVNSSTDTATFRLVNISTNVAIDLTTAGSNLVMAFPNGTRIDSKEIRSAQATRAASSAMTVCIFKYENSGGTPNLIQEIALATATASNTVIGANATILPTGGLILGPGESLGFTQSVYAGAQDRLIVTARGSHF